MTDELGDWDFPPGSKIREKEEYQMSIGGESLELTEYWIDRCLIDIENGSRFYYVITADDEERKHFYAASAIEGTYELIDGPEGDYEFTEQTKQ